MRIVTSTATERFSFSGGTPEGMSGGAVLDAHGALVGQVVLDAGSESIALPFAMSCTLAYRNCPVEPTHSQHP